MSKPLITTNGFSLIELIITISIIAIIASIAAPSMKQQMDQYKIKNTANIFESALKNARAEALITQKNTKVVLTNTAVEKSLKLFYVGEVTSSATPRETFNLDKNIVITAAPVTLAAVSFTPSRRAYRGETTTNRLMGQDSSSSSAITGFSICAGSSTTKYTIKVDANANILTAADGNCS